MKKIHYIFATIIIIIALVLVVSNQRSKATDSNLTIKIGAILPLTGNQAAVGEGLKNSLELALADLRKTNTKYKYEVVYENTQFDPKLAVTAAHKLIDIDHVDAIVDAYAPIGAAISPITEANHIVHIGIAFDPKIAEGKYNFILFTTPETAAKTLLGEMQRKNIKTLGIFRLNNQGIYAVYDAIKRLSADYGVSIVSDEEFQPGERDFKSIIAKSAKTNPEIYALLSIPPELEILAKQMNDQGLHNQTTAIYFELSQNKAIFEGLWSAGYSQVDPDFGDRYREIYKKDFAFGAPNIYDAFNVIVKVSESYEGKDKPSTEYIAEQIQKIKDVKGTLGVLNINPEGIIDSPAAIKIVKDGKMEILK